MIDDRRTPSTSTSERILYEAARLFSTQGFGTTSTRDIAAAVGITQPGLYRHFASKDDVLVALFDRATSYPISIAVALAAHDVPDPQRLYRFLFEAAKHLSTAPLILAAIVHTPELQLPAFASQAGALSKLARLIEAMIAGGVASGDFRSVNPRSSTLMIFEATNVFANPVAVPTAQDDLLDFVFAALLRRRESFTRLRTASLAIALPPHLIKG